MLFLKNKGWYFVCGVVWGRWYDLLNYIAKSSILNYQA